MEAIAAAAVSAAVPSLSRCSCLDLLLLILNMCIRQQLRGHSDLASPHKPLRESRIYWKRQL